MQKIRNVRKAAQQKYQMFTGHGSGTRDNPKMGGKGSESSYVPTTKKLSSPRSKPRFHASYLKDHNSSGKKSLRSSVQSSIDKPI